MKAAAKTADSALIRSRSRRAANLGLHSTNRSKEIHCLRPVQEDRVRIQEQLQVTRPDSEWSDLGDEQPLRAIGAATIDDGVLRPTIAGLTMFGAGYDIRPEIPGYMLDYREFDDGSWDWTARFTSIDGD